MRRAHAKGLILVGAGERGALAQCAGVHVSQLVPIANKPLVLYALEGMRAARIEDVGIVATAAGHESIRQLVGDGAAFGLRVHYVLSESGTGLLGGLLSAERWLHDAPCVVHATDGLLRADIGLMLEELHVRRLDALLLVDEGSGGAVPRLRERGISRLMNASEVFREGGKLAGVHVFGPRFVKDAVLAARRGEVHGIADVLEGLLASGGRAAARRLDGWWRPVTDGEELLEANRLVLDGLHGTHVGVNVTGGSIRGRVSIRPSARLEATIVRGPAVIGDDACLLHAYVGPYTTIGDGVTVEGAEIEQSVILAGATIKYPGGRIEASVVGRDAKVVRDFTLPRAIRLRVAAGDEISLC